MLSTHGSPKPIYYPNISLDIQIWAWVHTHNLSWKMHSEHQVTCIWKYLLCSTPVLFQRFRLLIGKLWPLARKAKKKYWTIQTTKWCTYYNQGGYNQTANEAKRSAIRIAVGFLTAVRTETSSGSLQMSTSEVLNCPVHTKDKGNTGSWMWLLGTSSQLDAQNSWTEPFQLCLLPIHASPINLNKIWDKAHRAEMWNWAEKGERVGERVNILKHPNYTSNEKGKDRRTSDKG